jgi:hypothetical protein
MVMDDPDSASGVRTQAEVPRNKSVAERKRGRDAGKRLSDRGSSHVASILILNPQVLREPHRIGSGVVTETTDSAVDDERLDLRQE